MVRRTRSGGQECVYIFLPSIAGRSDRGFGPRESDILPSQPSITPEEIYVEQIILKLLKDAVQKLGVVGTISYVGAAAIFVLLMWTNFETEKFKVISLSVIGIVLLIYSGVIYWQETKQETEKVREALGVLREVYNRMAEQISVADKDKTVSITMTIDNLPDKIAEVIKKSSNSK